MNWHRMSVIIALLFIAAFGGAVTQSASANPVRRGPTLEEEQQPAKGRVEGVTHVTPEMAASLPLHHFPAPPPGAPLPGPVYGGFKYTSAVTGIVADFSTTAGIVIQDSTPTKGPGLHTETMRPYKGCLETGFIHWLVNGQSTTNHNFYTYDWCPNGPGGDGHGGYQTFISTSTPGWATKYVNTSAVYPSLTDVNLTYADRSIHIREFNTDPGVSPYCTEVDLWNYQTQVYDYFDKTCGTDSAPEAYGWAIFEPSGWTSTPYPPCVQLGTSYNVAEARNILYRDGTSHIWYYMTQTQVHSILHPAGESGQCVGETTSYPWYFRYTDVSGNWYGSDWVVCGSGNGNCRP